LKIPAAISTPPTISACRAGRLLAIRADVVALQRAVVLDDQQRLLLLRQQAVVHRRLRPAQAPSESELPARLYAQQGVAALLPVRRVRREAAPEVVPALARRDVGVLGKPRPQRLRVDERAEDHLRRSRDGELQVKWTAHELSFSSSG
jgi:hypothetical protein